MENILPGDIKQGNLGNCWFVASLTGLANVPDGIKRICVEYDTSKFAKLCNWIGRNLGLVADNVQPTP